jgi:hypothetical protein
VCQTLHLAFLPTEEEEFEFKLLPLLSAEKLGEVFGTPKATVILLQCAVKRLYGIAGDTATGRIMKQFMQAAWSVSGGQRQF